MRFLVALSLFLAACGSGNTAVNAPEPTAEARALRNLAAEIMQRPELDVERVTVQHCLIGVRSTGGLANRKSLSHFDAEQRAAELLKEALAGADFRKLVLENTYDHITLADAPGVYVMVRPNPPDLSRDKRTPLEQPENKPAVMYRDEMVSAFWRVAWRLQVGEVGVTEKSDRDSPYGYHIIKRIE